MKHENIPFPASEASMTHFIARATRAGLIGWLHLAWVGAPFLVRLPARGGALNLSTRYWARGEGGEIEKGRRDVPPGGRQPGNSRLFCGSVYRAGTLTATSALGVRCSCLPI